MYKQLIQLNVKIKPKNPIKKKWVGDLSTHFSKDVQVANRHMKRRSTSLIITEMQIGTTMRYCLTPVRMTIIKKTLNHKRRRECREEGTLLRLWWECKLVNPLWKTVWSFRKNWKRSCQMFQQPHCWACIQRELSFKKIEERQCSQQYHLQ